MSNIKRYVAKPRQKAFEPSLSLSLSLSLPLSFPLSLSPLCSLVLNLWLAPVTREEERPTAPLIRGRRCRCRCDCCGCQSCRSRGRCPDRPGMSSCSGRRSCARGCRPSGCCTSSAGPAFFGARKNRGRYLDIAFSRSWLLVYPCQTLGLYFIRLFHPIEFTLQIRLFSIYAMQEFILYAHYRKPSRRKFISIEIRLFGTSHIYYSYETRSDVKI
jgi:hypothetical protein